MTEPQINIKQLLQNIRLKLLDLTKRNKLLNFRRSKESIFIVDELPNQVFQRLGNQGKPMIFKPLPELEVEEESPEEEGESGLSKKELAEIREAEKIRRAADETGIRTSLDLPQPVQEGDSREKKHADNYLQTRIFLKPLETRLRRIMSGARSVIEETGQNQLFMAFSFLEWKDSSDSQQSYLAPLILMPVELERGKLEKRTKTYQFSVNYRGEDLFPNLTLSEKLKEEFGLILPTFDDERVVNNVNGDEVLDPEKYFSLVQDQVSEMRGWKVRRQIVLGFFTFSKLLMYLDLNPKSWGDGKGIAESELIRDLLMGREMSDPDLPSEERDEEEFMDKIPVVVDADGSQLTALHEALSGRSMVIEGPPGTGKSQTITNLIAAYLNEGKSVLFVAEKMAALNVVRNNLNKVRLGEFCLELHSHKARKKKVLEDIDKRRKARYRDPGRLDEEIKRLKDYRSALREYVDTVKSVVGPYGETIFDVFWRVEALRTELPERNVDLSFEDPRGLKSRDIDERVSLLKEIARHVSELGVPSKNPLYGFNLTELFYGKEDGLKIALESARDAITQLNKKLGEEFSALGMSIEAESFNLEKYGAISGMNPNDIPTRVEEALFETFVDTEGEAPWKCLEELNVHIDRYRDRKSVAGKSLRDPDGVSEKSLKATISTCAELNDIVGDEFDLDELAEIRKSVSTLRGELSKIEGLSRHYVKHGMKKPNSAEEFFELGAVSRFLTNRPRMAGLVYSRELFSDQGATLFEEIVEEGSKLKEEIRELAETFAFSDIPSRDEIGNIRRVLRVKLGKLFAFLASDYRKAKRSALVFLRDPKALKNQRIIRQLEQLEKHLGAQERFLEKAEYKNLLGSTFKGIDSYWDGLNRACSWTQKLKKAVGSERVAHKLSEAIGSDKGGSSEGDALQDAIDGIKREIEYLGGKIKRSFLSEAGVGLASTRCSVLEPRLSDVDVMLSKLLETVSPDVHSGAIKLSGLQESSKAQIDVIGLKSEVEAGDKYSSLLGDSFSGIDSDLRNVNNTSKWLKKLKDSGVPGEYLKSLFQGEYKKRIGQLNERTEEFGNLVRAFEEALEDIAGYGFVNETKAFGSSVRSASFMCVAEKLGSAIGAVGKALRWAEYSRTTKVANEKGLDAVLEGVEVGDLPHEKLVTMYQLALYHGIAQELVGENPVLSSFSRAQHEEKRKRFVELDRKILELSRERIGYQASRKEVPRGVSRGPVKSWSESSLLGREINKSMRHLPIRRLLERAGGAIRALKPCFMMSPMSVAQYLEPGKHEFDVVIMDEASQIKPHESFGAVARGKQIIIVGDPKQLPPTTFFDAMATNPVGDDEEDLSTVDDMDSILDLCMSHNFPVKRLKWHYRSEHESLIAFSNSQWYDNELIIFPSPDGSRTELGIKYHYIPDARYSAGRNIREAEYVAQAVIDHAKRSPYLSLGVGTFNIQQKNLIEDILDKLRKEDPSNDTALERLSSDKNGGEPLFIKNLENLQGDERDVIYICCTYGPDIETGKVYQRFGPINGKYGTRRLNVMFTRAKKRMEVFTSMTSEDVLGGANSNPGAIALKRFLRYSDTGILMEEGEVTGKEPDSDFEVAVAKALGQHGYSVEPQVGVSGYRIDLGVYHPDREGEFIVGIECDGATYHSARHARDRDRLREEVLVRRGWTIHRIWSADWFKNRIGEVDRLVTTLNKIRETDRHRARKVELPELTKPTERKPEERDTGQVLKAKLLKYRNENIPPREEAPTDGLLRNEMLVALIETRPTIKEEFRGRVPLQLREKINLDELQYLDDVLGIIEEAEAQ